jgi:hypothetical protein
VKKLMMFYKESQLREASLFRLKELYSRDFFNWKTNSDSCNELKIITGILRTKSFEDRLSIDRSFRSHQDSAIKDGNYKIADKDAELRDYFHCTVLD